MEDIGENHSQLIADLVEKGLPEGVANAVASALGEDEITFLPPAFLLNLVAGLLHTEAIFKKAQSRLAGLNAVAQYAVTTALPAEQAVLGASVTAMMMPFGNLYGIAATVRRMAQSLSFYYQQELSRPFKWGRPKNIASLSGAAAEGAEPADGKVDCGHKAAVVADKAALMPDKIDVSEKTDRPIEENKEPAATQAHQQIGR